MSAARKFFILIGAMATIALTAYAGWFYYQNSLSNSVVVAIENAKFSGGVFSYDLQTQNRTRNDVNLTITEIPYKQKEVKRTVYFYYDQDYPMIGTAVGDVLGVQSHLLAEFQQKNVMVDVKMIHSSQLPDILDDPDSVVIMTTGVLPDTVYSKATDMVSPWLKSGGTLIWAGDGFGYYYGTKGGKITSADSPTTIGWSGQRELLGQNYLEGSYIPKVEDSLGDSPSFLANALGIRSRLTQTGAFVSALISGQSLDLGYNYSFETESRTSLSAIKVERGVVYLFGGMLLNRETDVAWDISQLLISNIVDADTAKITSRKVVLQSGSSNQSTQKLTIADDKNIRVIVFIPGLTERYFYSQEFNHD